MLYLILSLFTSTLGSLIGIGGGVILRPSLIFFKETAAGAAALSTFSVFVMSVISTVKYGHLKKIDYKTGCRVGVLLVPGSFIGTKVIHYIPENIINGIYVLVLFVLICLMLFKKKIKKIEVSMFVKLILSFLIGFCAGVLGIGGGPFLIPLLLYVFFVEEDKLSGTSVMIVLISSAFSLGQHILNSNLDYSKILPLAVGAIIGSLIGTEINKRTGEKIVLTLYSIVLIVLFISGIYFTFISN